MDLEQSAFEALRFASAQSLKLYKQPLVITYSGGKDSDVLLHLAGKSGIPYEVLHSLKVRTFFIGHPSGVRWGDNDGGIQMIRTTECDVPMRDFGRTVFLTRKEAEKALEKMEGKKVNENFEKIKGRLGEAEVLAQLAEECAELAQAALKMRRALDRKNPTPKTVEECRRDLCEEYLDVIICTGVLNLDLPPEGVERKMLRWMKRLGIRNGDCGTKGPPGALGVDPRGERGT